MAGTEEEVVLRLLRGEDVEAVSRETGIDLDELAQWLENYMKAGREGLRTRVGAPLDSEHLAPTEPTWSPWTEQTSWLRDY